MSEEKLIPGVFDKKTNKTIHYGHIGATFATLFVVLIIVTTTFSFVVQINSIAKETGEVLSSVKSMLPEAQMAIDMMKAVCFDKNFTKSNYTRAVCEKYL